MQISGFVPFHGQHCETTATGSLIQHLGLGLSEPMLFGLGEGLGFVYWAMRGMAPFLGGRSKPGQLTRTLARNLNLRLDIHETASARTAWRQVQGQLDAGMPVGIQLDSYYLDYFTAKIHFAGHFVALYGYDDRHAYLVDTAQQGGAVQTSLENLAKARGAKGPLAANNLSYVIAQTTAIPALAVVIPQAIRANALAFVRPPIANLGYKGIAKAGTQVRGWLARGEQAQGELTQAALLMERGGTGGALFRMMYRDFLGACLDIVDHPQLAAGYRLYCAIAPQWTEVARLLDLAGATAEQAHLDQASALLIELSQLEKEAMDQLARLPIPEVPA